MQCIKFFPETQSNIDRIGQKGIFLKSFTKIPPVYCKNIFSPYSKPLILTLFFAPR